MYERSAPTDDLEVLEPRLLAVIVLPARRPEFIMPSQPAAIIASSYLPCNEYSTYTRLEVSLCRHQGDGCLRGSLQGRRVMKALTEQ